MFEAETNITGVRLLVGSDLVEGGISLEDGKILEIAKESNLPKAEQTYNVKGLVACPGFIDAHVHLRDLQLSYKEDFFTGTCAAAAGGFTTVLDMPNNLPPTNSAQNLRLRRDAAANKIVVNVGFHAELVSDDKELKRMRDMGAFSFKLYLNDPAASVNTDDDSALIDVFSVCALMKTPVTVHAEDRASIEKRAKEFRGKPLGPEDYSHVHSPSAELKAVRRILELAGKSGARLHLCHVTLGPSLDAIEEARNSGINVSCEITPHHLFLSKKDVDRLGGWALTAPPLRNSHEVRILWKGLSSLEFPIIASDHAPHSLLEKSSSDAREIKSGIPGLETTIPLMLTQVNRGEFTLPKLCQVLAERPAKFFGLKGKGMLSVGADADITILDLSREHTIDPEKFHSKAKHSPFSGQKCKGGISKVFVGGQLVFDEGEIVVPPGTGRVVDGVSR